MWRWDILVFWNKEACFEGRNTFVFSSPCQNQGVFWICVLEYHSVLVCYCNLVQIEYFLDNFNFLRTYSSPFFLFCGCVWRNYKHLCWVGKRAIDRISWFAASSLESPICSQLDKTTGFREIKYFVKLIQCDAVPSIPQRMLWERVTRVNKNTRYIHIYWTLSIEILRWTLYTVRKLFLCHRV